MSKFKEESFVCTPSEFREWVHTFKVTNPTIVYEVNYALNEQGDCESMTVKLVNGNE